MPTFLTSLSVIKTNAANKTLGEEKIVIKSPAEPKNLPDENKFIGKAG